MTIDLVHQVKSRARSVQLDKNAVSASVTEIDSNTTESPPTAKPRPNSVSGTGQENARKSSVPASAPSTVRPVRSMLQVGQPPNLRPLEPMLFDELYSPPEEKTGAFLQWEEATTTTAATTPTQNLPLRLSSRKCHAMPRSTPLALIYTNFPGFNC